MDSSRYLIVEEKMYKNIFIKLLYLFTLFIYLLHCWL